MIKKAFKISLSVLFVGAASGLIACTTTPLEESTGEEQAGENSQESSDPTAPGDTSDPTSPDTSDASDTSDAADVSDASDSSDPDNGGEPWVSPESLTERQTLSHDGLSRRYFLHVPENLPQYAPLVIVMHGYTGSANNIMNYSGMNQVADENGFVVAYPQGTRDDSNNRFFNVGYDFHGDVQVDDVGFIKEIISSLRQTYSLSETNVFATGMSNGADMSYLLACEASDVFKAIAPVAGMILQSIYDRCEPQSPMPVFEIHGTEDYVTYWEGDMDNDDGWGAYPDMRTMIDFWVNLNGLEQSETTDIEDTNTNDGSSVVFERYWSDSTVNEVWFYKVMGGGHDWPGAEGNMDIDSSTDMWMFFSKYLED
ncbi:MAG: prolyl oligopeptidase family serine peptidase [Deltaproteobacteria bacterium]|nr:prolyl oligopeptidase family serine peptidase [Deltaproteobacteria bacterium]